MDHDFNDNDNELGIEISSNYVVEVLDVFDADVSTRSETNIEFIDIDHIPMTIEVECTFSVRSSEEGR